MDNLPKRPELMETGERECGGGGREGSGRSISGFIIGMEPGKLLKGIAGEESFNAAFAEVDGFEPGS
jgi:hypothetical protein